MHVDITRIGPETADEFGFRENIETIGGFVEENYLTSRQQVKTSLECPLETLRPLRQHGNFTKIACKKGHHPTALAEVGLANHQPFRLFAS
ncbi:MAG: hypothetical protein R3C12_10175 [Planctomycetaceae bacterium]